MITVLGATGYAGRAVVKEIAERGLPVLALARDGRKLEKVAAAVPGLVETGVCDSSDQAGLQRALRRSTVLVNCVGPYIGMAEPILSAALQAQAHYIDIASEQEHYRRAVVLRQRARESALFFGIGMGAYPGLSGILLSSLLQAHPRSTSAELVLRVNPVPTGEGVAQIMSGILEMNYPLTELQDGALVQVRHGIAESVQLPDPFGMSRLLRWPQLEVLAGAEDGQLRAMRAFISLGHAPPRRWEIALVRALRPHRFRWSYRLLRAVAGRPRALPEMEDRDFGLIRARVEDDSGWHERILTCADVARATAWLPAFLCERLYAEETFAREHAGLQTALTFKEPGAILAALIEERGDEVALRT